MSKTPMEQEMEDSYDQSIDALRRITERHLYRCQFCGLPSAVDPSDQEAPPDYRDAAVSRPHHRARPSAVAGELLRAVEGGQVKVIRQICYEGSEEALRKQLAQSMPEGKREGAVTIEVRTVYSELPEQEPFVPLEPDVSV